MDWINLPGRLLAGIKKYRYALLVAVLGLALMAIPKPAAREQTPSQPLEADAPDFSQELSQLLSRIEGVGKAQVLLTEAKGSETVYQADPGSGEGLDTVILSRGSGQQEGLVRQVNPPSYLGAVVVCEGGDEPIVRLHVVEAVSRVTGLGADQISVLKMH